MSDMTAWSQVEKVAMMIGAFELVFLITMVASPVDMDELGRGLGTFPSASNCKTSVSNCSKDYILLLAGESFLQLSSHLPNLLPTANIGAVIMPWMVVLYPHGELLTSVTDLLSAVCCDR